jgi:hypothetical protein
MLRPGGAFLLVVAGVFMPPGPAISLSLALSIGASPGFAVCNNLDSIICLCCSRTEILRCNCSLIVGSCVTNPGERQAKPTSWIPRPLSLDVNGAFRPVIGFEPDAFFDRSSLRGRWRGVGRSGEEGSFFTTILGGPAFSRRELKDPTLAIQAYDSRETGLTTMESSWVQIALLGFHSLCVVQTYSALPKRRHDLEEGGEEIWEQIQARYRRRMIDRAVLETEPL